MQAIEAVRAAGHDVCGVVAVLDRLAGGADAIRRAAGGAPYAPLATIDELYPDRPDALRYRRGRLGNTKGTARVSRVQRPEQDSNLRPTP